MSENFSKKIKDIRAEYGLTQKKLSELTGIPKRTIENWEGGQRKPGDWVIGLIEKSLKYDELIKNK